MAEIDNLTISITANADRAVNAINRLSSSLGGLNSAARNTGSSLQPIDDGMTDAASHTEDASESVSTFRDRLNRTIGPIRTFASAIGNTLVGGIRGVAHGIGGVLSGLVRIAKFRIYRTIIKDLGQSFKDLYGWSNLFGTDFAKSMDRIYTSLTYFRNSIAAMVAPLVNALAPAIDFVVDKFVGFLNIVNQLLAALSGADTYTVARKVALQWGDAFDSASQSVKKTADEIKRTILGFDELNKLNGDNAKGSGTGSGSSPYSAGYKDMFEEKALSSGWKSVGNSISKWVSDEIGKINAIIDASAFAVGLILATHGQPAVGIGLMAAAALNAGANVVAYSDTITPEIKALIAGILGIAGIAFAVGAVLAFSSGNVGLGIGMMAASVGALSGSYKIVSVNWDSISALLKSPIGTITALVSGALLAVGAILAFSGASIPIGIGMMVAGAAGLATTVSANWDIILDKLKGPIGAVTALVSGALLAVGIIALIGGAIPLGIGLILAGAAGLVTTVAANWDNMKDLGSTAFKKLKEGWDSLAEKALELKATIVTKAKELWDSIKTKWDNLKEKAVSLGAKISTKAKELWDGLKTKWDNLKDKTVSLGAKISAKAKDLWDSIKTKWDNLKDKTVSLSAKISTKAKDLWDGIKTSWNNLKDKAVSFAAKIETKVKDLWNTLSVAWGNLKDKVVTFAANVANDAKNWWSNVSAWWSSTRSKVVTFAAKVSNDAKKWWENVSAWWSETKSKVVTFAAKVADDAKTWWSNVKSWWKTEIEGKSLKEIVTNVSNKASDWWKDVKSWWKTEIEGKSLQDIVTNVSNKASDWWSNVKSWWKTEIEGKSLQDIITNVSNKASDWWSNVKSWWSAETTGKTVADFIANVKDKAVLWWTDVKSWWAGETDGKTVEDFVANVKNKASDWWQNVKDWWKDETDGKTVEDFVANVKNKASDWWSDVQNWWKTETTGKTVADFIANVKNKAVLWWTDVKSWWAGETDGNTVEDFVANVKNKAAAWWKDVKGWWKEKVNSTSIKEIEVGVFNDAKEWWNDVVTWWKEITSEKWLGIQLRITPNGESADMEEYAASGGQYSQEWYDAHIGPIQDTIDDNPLNVSTNLNNDTDEMWGNLVEWWDSEGKNWWNELWVESKLNDNVGDLWGSLVGWWVRTRDRFGLGDDLTAWATIEDTSYWLWNALVGWWVYKRDHQGWGDDLTVQATIENNTSSLWSSLVSWWDSVKGWFSVSVRADGGGFAEGGFITAGGRVGRFAKGGYINAYAGGTSRAHGSLFIAGEAGPEIVGHIGGRTEVLNKSQIAQAIYSAVRSAMSGVEIAGNFYSAGGAGESAEAVWEMMQESRDATDRQNELLRQQNEYLRMLYEKDTTVEISTSAISRGLTRQNRRAGTTVVPVGT